MTASTSLPPALPEKHRILIVDDEEIVLVGLRETLRRAGYEVVAGSNALAGLEALRTARFSVVITDQQMPWMSGLEFLAQVKELQPDASRILITAVLSLDTVVDAINKGEIYRFVIKPWLREELLATVTNAVQRYEMVRQHADLQAATLRQNQELTALTRALEEKAATLEARNQQLAATHAALDENLLHSAQISVRLLETLHPAIGAQTRRVVEICRAVAETAALSAEERAVLAISSHFYDVGLAAMPADLVNRWRTAPESLNATERRRLEEHPILGQEWVRFGDVLEQVGLVIRSHHERFDGTGYPDRRSGDRIPWLSRLLAVAIEFAGKARLDSNGIESIQAESGTAFDPEAIRALLRAIPKLPAQRQAREVPLSELRPGMILAKGIYTANGALVWAENQPLSAPAIERLANHPQLQATTGSLLVYC